MSYNPNPEPIIIDAPVIDIRVPTLVLSAYSPKSFVKKIYNKTRSAINTFGDLLLSYIPPKPKKIVNEKLDALQTTVKAIFQFFL